MAVPITFDPCPHPTLLPAGFVPQANGMTRVGLVMCTECCALFNREDMFDAKRKQSQTARPT